MKNRIFISGSIVVLAVIACVVPGLSQPVAPTLDVNNLPTVIALTANAAMAQTAAVAPPVAAETSIPSGATQAVDLTRVTTLEQSPGESTKFTDSEAGFVVTYPKGWLTLRPNSEEFNSALANEAVKNEMLHDQMESDQTDYEPGLDRLYSYPLLPDIEKNSMFGASSIAWDSTDTSPIDENSMGDFFRDLETRVVRDALGHVRRAGDHHVNRQRGHDRRAVNISQAFGPDGPVGRNIGGNSIVNKAGEVQGWVIGIGHPHR